LKNPFKREKHLLPERNFYKLEGDQEETFSRFGKAMDYRPFAISGSPGVAVTESGGYGLLNTDTSVHYNAGPALNTDPFSFGFPGDYTDYNGLN
jgi:hypothetical protein